MYSIMALGVMPFVSGFVIVEVIALLVPSWRPLRTGDRNGRATLNRRSVLLGLIFVASQSLVLSVGLQGMGIINPMEPLQRLMFVLTLIGAAMVQLTFVQVVNRDGMGGGFAILLLADMIRGASMPIWRPLFAGVSNEDSSSNLLLGILSIVIVVVVVLRLFRMGPGFDNEGTLSSPRNGRSAGGAHESAEAMNFSRIIAVVGYWSVAHKVNLPAAVPPTMRLGILVIAALLFVWLFNPPAKMTEAWKQFAPNFSGGVPPMSIVFRECIAFIGVLSLVQFWTTRHLGFSGSIVMSILLVTAIVCDLIREWHAREHHPDLVPVWDVHQPYVVPPLLLCLKNEGIRVFPQNLFFRSLLQFFGPYVPIRILVPADQASAADAILRERFSTPTAPSQASDER